RVLAAPPGESLRFHAYTQEDGLVQNSVRTIVQDRTGFLWFGSEDGLHRFDGYEMTVWQARPDDPDGLQADGIQALLADPSGDVWVGTYGGGVSRYSAADGRYLHFRHDDADPASLRSDFVLRLARTPGGQLWVVHSAGIDRIDPASREVRQ